MYVERVLQDREGCEVHKELWDILGLQGSMERPQIQVPQAIPALLVTLGLQGFTERLQIQVPRAIPALLVTLDL
jgi:hypothetical protein